MQSIPSSFFHSSAVSVFSQIGTDVFFQASEWFVTCAILGFIGISAIIYAYTKTPARGPFRFAAALLKVIAIAVLLLCLLEPLIKGSRPRPGANVFPILVDKSQSMELRAEVAERISETLSVDSPWKARLDQDFDVRNYVFANQMQHVETYANLSFDGSTSTLAGSIHNLSNRFRSRPVAGILLFTDGNATDLDESNTNWKDLDVPVFPVVSTIQADDQDLRIDDIRVAQTNFEAAPTTIEAVIACVGVNGREVVGKILDQDDNVVKEERAKIKKDEDMVPFRFRFRPKDPGLSFYQFHAALDGDEQAHSTGDSDQELTLQNNSQTVAVDRGGGPYRVLYVSGRPNWEFKFLRRALDEDEEIKLVGLLRLAKKEPKFTFRDQSKIDDTNQLFRGFENEDEQDTEEYDQPVLVRFGIEDDAELRDGFPKSPEELFAYHAIIIDDLESSFFTQDQMTLIRRFVNQRGGGFMMFGGAESFAGGKYERTPIGDLLPVYSTEIGGKQATSGLAWNLTREGALQPWARVRSTQEAQLLAESKMPRFMTINHTGGIKPGASTIAEANAESGQLPLLVTQRFGKGRTAAITVGDMWRWSLRRASGEENDLAQFWRQTVRWLVSDVPKRVETKHSKFVPGRPVRIDTVVRSENFENLDNARVSYLITTPSGKVLETDAQPTKEPGVYSLDYSPRESGGYRVVTRVTGADGAHIDSQTTGWSAIPAADEFKSLKPNLSLLEEIASQTGGKILDVEDLDEFVQDFPNRKTPITETWVYPIWHHPFVLGFAILCLCGEWGIRRWKGLP